MRKHPLVKNMRKLNFHLVPVSGVAKRNGGDKKFRAEFAVVKLNEDFWSDEKAEDKHRYLRASILPE